MIRVRQEPIVVDVDGTLVSSKKINGVKPIKLNNHGIEEWHYPIYKHVNLIKKNKNRGMFIIVWSQNGGEWAEEVVMKLGLFKYVDMVSRKPNIYVDDLEFSQWCFRIHLTEEKK